VAKEISGPILRRSWEGQEARKKLGVLGRQKRYHDPGPAGLLVLIFLSDETSEGYGM
jgi:hypothetical protein